MQILIALTPEQRLHGAHPEVVGISTDDMNCLAKTKLNLEAVAVELDDLQWWYEQVGTHQKNHSTIWMFDNHKAYEMADGAPEQVQATIAQGDIVLTINRARGRHKGSIIFGQIFECDFVAVDAWTAFATLGFPFKAGQ
jgi:hypothetical protein